MPPYVDPTVTLSRRLGRVAQMVAIGLFCVAYGAGFGLFGAAAPSVFLMPIFVLLGLVFWALPDVRTAPFSTLGSLFFITTATVATWPNYLAVTLPGLPWITVSRLTDAPMVIVFLYCISTSKAIRSQLGQVLGESSMIFKLLIAFVGIQLITLPFSHAIGGSLQQFVVAQINWTTTFFIAAFVFSRKGTATKWAVMLWVVAVLQGLLSVWEHHVGHVVWRDDIPSFLQIADPTVARILTPEFRGYGNQSYRSQGTFDGPIQLGEFLVLCFTFVMHFAVEGRSATTRLLARISAPFLLAISLATGSRSSAVGFVVAIGVYALYVGARWWRRHPQGLVAPLFIISYPIMGLAAFASSFLVYRIRAKVWGTGGANQASTQARVAQYNLGIPKILSQPWGHGAGQAGITLGYQSPGANFYTIDSYYLALMLDYGIIGFIIYMMLFLFASYKGVRSAIFNDPEDWEISLLAPAGVSLINFIVIKAVFNQADNHVLFFAVLGMIPALLWRAKTGGMHAARTQGAPNRQRLQPRTI